MIKIIGVLARNSGGKWKWNILCIGSMPLLNMTLFFFRVTFGISSLSHLSFQVWVIHFCLSFDYSSLSWWPLVLCWVKCCPSPELCHQCSKEVLSTVIYLYIVWPIVTVLDLIHFIPLYSLFHVNNGGFFMALLRWVTSCWLQLIIWEDDLETPFPYLRDDMP